MTHRSLTATLWGTVPLVAVCAVLFAWAATISVVAAVAAAGPLAITVGATAAAWEARRELRATHVADLAAANARENDIAAR